MHSNIFRTHSSLKLYYRGYNTKDLQISIAMSRPSTSLWSLNPLWNASAKTVWWQGKFADFAPELVTIGTCLKWLQNKCQIDYPGWLEFAGLEYAGLENDGQKPHGGICWPGNDGPHCRTGMWLTAILQTNSVGANHLNDCNYCEATWI